MDYPSKRRYDEQNTIQVKIKLNKKTDADIIAYLEASGNKQGTIKEALREKMALGEELSDEAVAMMKEAIRENTEKRISDILRMCADPIIKKS